jgi:hypothetical protein
LEDEVQQTPIDVAAACGNKDILELFEKKIWLDQVDDGN